MVYDASIPTRSAIWGTSSSKVNSLSGKTFSMGTGSGNGNGNTVINNAGAIACYHTQCRSWVNPNQSGNYDYIEYLAWGQLDFSWNNEASTSSTG